MLRSLPIGARVTAEKARGMAVFFFRLSPSFFFMMCEGGLSNIYLYSVRDKWVVW